MTIICYRDGVMAADSAGMSGRHLTSMDRKIVRSLDGSLAASAGSSWLCSSFARWALAGFPADQRPDTWPKGDDEDSLSSMVVRPDGTIWRYLHPDRWNEITFPFVADGIAWQFAYGAMAAGASAKKAVELAIKNVDGCRGPVQVEKLG